MTEPFKVGDKVVTHKPEIIISASFTGKVGVVTSVDPDYSKGNHLYTILYGEISQWGYHEYDSLELVEDHKVVSDGGPSGYYDFPKGWVTWNDLSDYKSKAQWKEYSFHLANIGKAIYRWGEKEGTTIKYDTKKIIYSGLRVLLMMSSKSEVRGYLKELLEDPQFKGD